MTPISEVQSAVVASLRGLPQLVTELGGDDSVIGGYDPEAGEFRTAKEAVAAMSEGGLLVIFEGLEETMRGEIPRFAYHFTIAMFCPGDFDGAGPGTHPGYFGLLKNIIDGDNGSGLRWFDSPIHEAFDPPSEPRFTRAGVDGAEVWQLQFSLLEIGG